MKQSLMNIPTPELERIWTEKRDELLKIRKELDRRKGAEPPPVSVDFESYVTK